ATLPFTLAPLVFGVDLAALERNRRSPPPRVRSGRLVPAPGSDEVVLGSQVARYFHVDTDGTIAIRGKTFRVAGVLEPTLTGPDAAGPRQLRLPALCPRREPTRRERTPAPPAGHGAGLDAAPDRDRRGRLLGRRRGARGGRGTHPRARRSHLGRVAQGRGQAA